MNATQNIYFYLSNIAFGPKISRKCMAWRSSRYVDWSILHTRSTLIIYLHHVTCVGPITIAYFRPWYNNTNLHPILHHFKVITHYWWNVLLYAVYGQRRLAMWSQLSQSNRNQLLSMPWNRLRWLAHQRHWRLRPMSNKNRRQRLQKVCHDFLSVFTCWIINFLLYHWCVRVVSAGILLCEWVSSFLTAHQHVWCYLVPDSRDVEDD